MQRIVLLLLGMASLAASGVIMDRGRVGLNAMGGLGLQTVQGIRGGVGGNVLTRDELLRQKFILDILHQVYAPVQQTDLLMMDEPHMIANENLYMRPLTQEMLTVLELISTNQIIGKQTIFNINNQHHIQQIVGLYRLLVTARDFDAFKRLAVYCRQNINTEVFVNCLVLALGERQDTEMLIVPALHEILPQLFVKDYVINQVQNLDTGVSSLRPQLADVVGMGRNNWLLNSRISNQQQGGLWNVLNRSQMWMPWRELHKQMYLRKIMGGNAEQQYENQMDKLVISVPGNGLLSHDIGLKSYVTFLIDELLVNQDKIRNVNQNQIGMGGLGSDNLLDVLTGINRNRVDNDIYTNSRYGNILNGRRGYNTNGGIRQGTDSDNGMYASAGRRHHKNRYDSGNDYNMEQNMYTGRRNMQEGQRGINTVSVNDARLLFVGRRHKNTNNVMNMGNDYYDEDDLISGGRHVSNDRQRNKHNNDDEDITIDDIRRMNNEQYININRRGMNNYNDEDDLGYNKNHGIRMNVNGYSNGQNQGYMGQNQYMDQYQNQDQDLMWNRGMTGQNNGDSLDMYLPTTSINDARLLHVNRHKLNTAEEEIRANNIGGGINEYSDDLYSTGYQRGGINTQGSGRGEESYTQQRSWDIFGRGNMNAQLGQWDTNTDNNREEQHGHRYRRSIINEELGQSNTINGKLILHTLQQLVARLNTERIALGQPQLIDDNQSNTVRGLYTNNLVGRGAINGLDAQTANTIEDIIQNIDQNLQQHIGQISSSSYNQKVNEIGLLLAGQIQDLGLVETLGQILQQTNQQQRKGKISNLLENEAAQILLAGIVKVVDQKVQQVFRQREDFISTVYGVNIDNVEVDQLQTFLEQTDIDLTNLLNINNMGQSTQGTNNKVVVGRVPRLNHKNFQIKIDVTSDRSQQVVVRHLLVPKVDGYNNIIPLAERRQNVIVLDITTADLQQGQNTLILNSNDITITSRDTTPLTKIYQLVMQALNGNIVLQQDQLAGQSSLLPHRLLLPRGRTNGLPMNLITVITPLQGSSVLIGGHTDSTGLNTLLFDNLPLNYPLHCDITDLDKVISMPNLMVKDVKIYHEDNIQSPFVRMY